MAKKIIQTVDTGEYGWPLRIVASGDPADPKTDVYYVLEMGGIPNAPHLRVDLESNTVRLSAMLEKRALSYVRRKLAEANKPPQKEE